MSEGFNDPGVPVSRGRRDPRVAAQIAAGRNVEDLPEVPMEGDESYYEGDEGQGQPMELPALLPGDIISARVHHRVEIDGGESNFSVGAQSRVQPEEDPVDAFVRVGDFVNTAVLDLAAAAEEPLRQENERRENERRSRPIRPRTNR